MIELKNNFFENLDFQIKMKKIEEFRKNLPTYKQQLHECHLAVSELRERFEEIRRRGTYNKIIEQIDNFIEKA